MKQIENWFGDGVLGASHLGPLAFFDWRGAPGTAQCELSWKHLQEHVATHPGGTLMFAVIRESANAMPDKGGREGVTKLLSHFRPHLKYRVAVIEGSGIARPFLRAFLFTTNALLGETKSSRIVGTVAEVADWTADKLRELDATIDLDGAALGKQLEAARGAHDLAWGGP